MLYNDAYGTLIGTKHPAALACSSKRKVRPEAWDFIGPRFDRVITHGQDASTLTDQMFTFYGNNYLEECYFSFSYSPIEDDNGNVGGVWTACLESTERVIEDRPGRFCVGARNLWRKAAIGERSSPSKWASMRLRSCYWGATQPVESSARTGTVPIVLLPASAETENSCQPGNLADGAKAWTRR
jgi:hypothetical protein